MQIKIPLQNQKWFLSSPLHPFSDSQIQSYNPDIWIMDWESSVPLVAKSNARRKTLPWLIQKSPYAKCIRINSIRTSEGLKDLLFLQENNVIPDILIISKVRTPTEFKIASALLQASREKIQLCATIEAEHVIGTNSSIKHSANEYDVHIFEHAMQEKLAGIQQNTL